MLLVQYLTRKLTKLSTGFLMAARGTALTSVKGAILISQHQHVWHGASAGLPRLVQLDQLQSRRCHGREAVELEGEIHSLGPRRFLAVLGHPECNKALNESGTHSSEPDFRDPLARGPRVRHCLLHPHRQLSCDLGEPDITPLEVWLETLLSEPHPYLRAGQRHTAPVFIKDHRRWGKAGCTAFRNGCDWGRAKPK